MLIIVFSCEDETIGERDNTYGAHPLRHAIGIVLLISLFLFLTLLIPKKNTSFPYKTRLCSSDVGKLLELLVE